MGDKRDKFKYETEHLNINDIAPDDDNGGKKAMKAIGNQSWWFKAQLVGIFLGFTIAVIGIIGLFGASFEPYTFYGWKDIPEQICPGEPLNTSTIDEVRSGPYTLSTVDGFASIVNSNNKAVDTWDIYLSDIEPREKQVTPSGVVRSAPLHSGYYKLGLNVTVNGRMYGMVPRYQEVEVYSDKSFFVLSESAKSCRDT